MMYFIIAQSGTLNAESDLTACQCWLGRKTLGDAVDLAYKQISRTVAITDRFAAASRRLGTVRLCRLHHRLIARKRTAPQQLRAFKSHRIYRFLLSVFSTFSVMSFSFD